MSNTKPSNMRCQVIKMIWFQNNAIVLTTEIDTVLFRTFIGKVTILFQFVVSDIGNIYTKNVSRKLVCYS